jgi:histidinol phosphatase-like PHP family hydrolase
MVNLSEIKYPDYHTHNGYYRGSGEEWTAAEGWAIAQQRQISLLGITNKVEYNHPSHDFIPILNKEIKDLRNPHVLMGIELDIGHPSGKNVLDPTYLPYLDFIIAAPHNQPAKTLAWDPLDEEDRAEYFGTLRDILVNSFKNAPVDIWAHPFLQEIDLTADYYRADLIPIFHEMLSLAANQGFSFEINENYFRTKAPPKESAHFFKNAEDYYHKKLAFLEELFSLALHDSHVLFTFASDTHALAKVGDIANCIKFAQKIGIPLTRIRHIEKKT